MTRVHSRWIGAAIRLPPYIKRCFLEALPCGLLANPSSGPLSNKCPLQHPTYEEHGSKKYFCFILYVGLWSARAPQYAIGMAPTAFDIWIFQFFWLPDAPHLGRSRIMYSFRTNQRFTHSKPNNFTSSSNGTQGAMVFASVTKRTVRISSHFWISYPFVTMSANAI